MKLFPRKYFRALIILCVLIQTGCLSEQEKKVKQRVNNLDEQIEINNASLESFFNALPIYYTNRYLIEAKTDSAFLSNNELTAFRQMSTNFADILISNELRKQIIDSLAGGKQIIGLYLDPKEEPNQTADRYIQYLQLCDEQLVFKIHDRLNGEEWPDDIGNPNDYSDDESRDNTFKEYSEAITNLTGAPFIFVVQELYIKHPKLSSDKEFESGIIFARVYLYNPKMKKHIGDFYIKAMNSSYTFTFSDKEESKIDDLLKDLRNSLFMDLKREFQPEK